MTTEIKDQSKEELKTKILKDNKSIERAATIKAIVKQALGNLVFTAMLYVITVVIVPIACKKRIEDLRDITLMIFIGLIFVMLLVVLFLSSRMIDKEKTKTRNQKELYKLVHPRKAAQMENKDGKEMVSK